ncbi:MAG: hypothetical protein UW94_C0009G0042 [Parcubacteria group bacterium GW2011_GWA2_45_14]|nr:MAG: hypothetical protein UW94_C0009G0042 [Parcubacteria group bacterium GW2011_GWA2_45_14]
MTQASPRQQWDDHPSLSTGSLQDKATDDKPEELLFRTHSWREPLVICKLLDTESLRSPAIGGASEGFFFFRKE